VAAVDGDEDSRQIAGARIQPAEMSAWLAQRFALYQNPRYLVEVVEFERTPANGL
jgi:hypothetical protein